MAIFLNSDISQGSVVIQLRRGELVNEDFVANLKERNLKISQHLAKLWAIL